MEHCRMCFRKTNLKYSKIEVKKQQIIENICLICEQKLEQYHNSINNGNIVEEEEIEVVNDVLPEYFVIDESDEQYVIDISSDDEAVPETPSQLNSNKCVNGARKLRRIRRLLQTQQPKRLVEVCSPIDLTSDDENEAGATANLEQSTIPVPTTPLVVDTENNPALNSNEGGNEIVFKVPAMPCQKCKLTFQNNLEYISHLRLKHRNKTRANMLIEEPNTKNNDSAMTIRLRFMQREIYFECLLCGHIDGEEQLHRSHLRSAHSDELMSLNEAIECKICKQEIEKSELDMFRHLMTSHSKDGEYLLSKLPGMYNEKKELVANVYKLDSCQKKMFYACAFCEYFCEGIREHKKHMEGKHKSKQENKQDQLKNPALLRLRSNSISVSTANEQKTSEATIGGHERSDNNSSGSSSFIENNRHSNNNKENTTAKPTCDKKIKKQKKTEGTIQMPSNNNSLHKSTRYISRNTSATGKQLKKEKTKAANEKPKTTNASSKSQKTNGNGVLSVKVAGKKQQVAAIVKVKNVSSAAAVLAIRAPILNVRAKFDTLYYQCKYCNANLSGFINFNAHLMENHKDDDLTSVPVEFQPRLAAKTAQARVRAQLQLESEGQKRRKMCAPKKFAVDENSNLHIAEQNTKL